MKRIGRAALVAAAAWLAAGAPLLAGNTGKTNTGRADRVFVNGRIWTGEPSQPLAQALAIRGSTILETGASDAIRKLAGKGTEVVDLRGRFVSPGFIDAHLHLLGGGWSLEELRLDDASDFATLQARVRAWAQANPEARWVTGEGWSYGAFPNGMPTRLQLDALVPDRPALLGSYDGHTGWANSAALRLAEITHATKDPEGGEIGRDAAGEPTGVLKESAQRLDERLLPKRLPYEDERAFRNAITKAASWGLTGVHQAGISEEELETLSRALQASPQLRVYAALRMERDPTTEVLARQQELRQRYSGPRLRVGAVKGFVDGVVEARTAAMFEPYADGGRGSPNWTQQELDRAVAAYDKAGFQVMLHAIGERGIDMALTAFERAAATNGTSARRHRVEHLEVPR
ncbi:MAG TPA: amidohydrolase, partial [Planctomycetota bacterium]|nr:amidohydrolase [Planctomycetota bacterium]